MNNRWSYLQRQEDGETVSGPICPTCGQQFRERDNPECISMPPPPIPTDCDVCGERYYPRGFSRLPTGPEKMKLFVDLVFLFGFIALFAATMIYHAWEKL